MNVREQVFDLIRLILKHQGLPEVEFGLESELYDEGIGLDSMCVAELSALLEKKFGKDPYTSGQRPRLVNDVVAFYD